MTVGARAGGGGIHLMTGGIEGDPLGGGDFDDFSPPPSRTGLWVGLAIVAVLVVGAGGAYVYVKGQEQQAMEELMARSGSMPPTERAAALRRVLMSTAHDSFRKDAAHQLGVLADGEAVPLLMDVISDPEELAQTAAVALGRMADRGRLGEGDQARARERIVPQLQKAQGMARTQFAFSLALLNDERCLEPLLQGYMDDDQARAIRGLDARLISRFASASKMVELTQSGDPAVRMFAAQALGEKGSPEGADSLSKLLGDGNRSVVQAAAESLAKVAPDRAGPELVRLMKSQPDLQASLVQALRDSVGAPGIRPIYDTTDDWDFKLRLLQHVRSPPPPGREQPPDVPRGIGDPRGGDMCFDFYTNYPGPHRVQKEMGLWCLEELGDLRAAKGLFEIAEEPFSTERDTIIDDSIKSIGALRLPGSQELLLKLLDDGKGRPATILAALGRVGDGKLGRKIERYTHCPEADVLSGGACDRETALRVLGKLRWDGAFKLLTGTAARRDDDKVATRIESRDVWQEFRLRDRIGALEGLAHLGDPAAAPLLIATMEDREDDPQIRLEAARALAYSANDEVVGQILAKISDSNLAVATRKYYAAVLWHNPNANALGPLVGLVRDGSTPSSLMLAAGFAIGEAGPAMADQEQLRSLLGLESSDQLVAASVAALLAGDEETINRLIMVFGERQGLESQVRDRASGPQGHPVYLTPALFQSGRIYGRLRAANQMRQSDHGRHGWAWQHLTDRMLRGTTNWPNGMSPPEIRQQLADDIRSSDNPEWQQMAALTLLRMGFRGMLLMLAAEDGPGAEVARQVLSGDL